MNSQCRAIPLTDLRIHLSTIPPRRCLLSRAAQPSSHSQDFDARLNAAIFERLLQWLGPDSYSASLKYESIRARLITMFRARRCVFAEDLADITFERVAHKLTDLTSQFIGDPAPYFYGVAQKIYLEYLCKLKTNQLRATCWRPTDIDDPESESMLDLLERALSTIPNGDRQLILNYYAWDGKNKVAHRRGLANQLGIGLNALRVRVFRIRMELKKNMVQLDAELVTKYLPRETRC